MNNASTLITAPSVPQSQVSHNYDNLTPVTPVRTSNDWGASIHPSFMEACTPVHRSVARQIGDALCQLGEFRFSNGQCYVMVSATEFGGVILEIDNDVTGQTLVIDEMSEVQLKYYVTLYPGLMGQLADAAHTATQSYTMVDI